MYTVKEVSKKLDISTHTIRYYTDLKLLPFVERDKNGNRLFNEKSLNWLLAAKFLRESGMCLKEVKHYFELCLKGNETFQERYDILKDLQIQTQKEFEKVQFRLSCINDKLNHCEEIKQGKCIDDCNPLNW